MDVGLAIVIAAMIPTAASLFGAYLQRGTHTKLEAIHRDTNSMKDQLVAATREAATASGIAQGKEIEKARADAEAVAYEVLAKSK